MKWTIERRIKTGNNWGSWTSIANNIDIAHSNNNYEFIDTNVISGVTYQYRVKEMETNSAWDTSNEILYDFKEVFAQLSMSGDTNFQRNYQKITEISESINANSTVVETISKTTLLDTQWAEVISFLIDYDLVLPISRLLMTVDKNMRIELRGEIFETAITTSLDKEGNYFTDELDETNYEYIEGGISS